MKKQLVVILSILILLCIATGAFYFFVISPTGTKKPFMEKPEFDGLMIDSNSPVIETEHISYVANEIGAYKLHKDLRTGDTPEIEFVIEDTSEVFTLRVIDGNPIVEKISANNPDMKLTTDQATFLKILSSDNINQKIAEEASSGKVGISLIADEVTLGMKGYKAIYDSLSKNQEAISGKAISKLNPVKVTIITKIIALLSLLAIIEVVYMIEK
ncbi:MAG: hypothetical protein V1859_01240 [archaeon]